eukprot:5901116-Pleurochrysis_carterae.AAC.6
MRSARRAGAALTALPAAACLPPPPPPPSTLAAMPLLTPTDAALSTPQHLQFVLEKQLFAPNLRPRASERPSKQLVVPQRSHLSDCR